MTARWVRVGRYPSHRECVEQNVRIDGNGCWIWQGSVHPTERYGSVFVDGRPVGAHRFSYEAFVGPIPDGLHLDHLCRTRSCVNPQHLEPVTLAENNRRAPSANGAKTHCRNNHPYDEANTYRSSNGRSCRRCNADAVARRKARLVGASR